MKTIIAVFFSIFQLTTFTKSGTTNSMAHIINNEEQAVLTVVRQLSEFMIERDTDAMSKILDNDFTLTHITAYVQPKAEWLNEVAKESMKYYSVKETSHEIKVIGNIAEITIKSLVDARIWGSRNTWKLQQKMKLEKTNGTWIILNSVASTY